MEKPEIVKSQYATSENLSLRQELHSYNINKYDWNEWCFDNMKIQSGARILELGCGNGLLWEKNIGKIQDNWDIVLSDLSEGMLDDTKKRLSKLQKRFSYEIIDIQSIPYPDESFNVVIARHMLYHVPDLNKAFNEIKRILKPGGAFYASTNSQKAMLELKHLADGFDKNINFTPQKHVDKFGLENGEELLKVFFHQTSLKLFEGMIVVDKPEPVVNYIKSLNYGKKYFSETNRESEFFDYINNEIQKKGSINITTIAGLFEAIRE